MAWTRELTNNHPLFMRQLRRFIYGASRPPLWPPLVYRKRDMFDYHPRWTKKIAKGRLFLELETSIKRILDLFLASIFIELRNWLSKDGEEKLVERYLKQCHHCFIIRKEKLLHIRRLENIETRVWKYTSYRHFLGWFLPKPVHASIKKKRKKKKKKNVA